MHHYDWRRPRTQQERRANSDPELREIGIRIRSKRSLRMLVTAYDDLPKESQRNWKGYRRTQWKGKYVVANRTGSAEQREGVTIHERRAFSLVPWSPSPCFFLYALPPKNR